MTPNTLSCEEFRSRMKLFYAQKTRREEILYHHLKTCAACLSWWEKTCGFFWDSANAAPQGKPAIALAEQIKSLLRLEENKFVYYDALRSPLGEILLACRQQLLCGVAICSSERQAFVDELEERFHVPVLLEQGRLQGPVQEFQEYFNGRRRKFNLQVDISWMSAFQRDVLQFTAEIPAGETRTYGEVARGIGSPGASRAVGNALGSNPVPIVIPCHRVLAANNKIGGYSGGGPEIKRRLLCLEGVSLPSTPRRLSL